MFGIDNEHKGMIFVSKLYGARDFLVYNTKTGVAITGDARSNPTGIDTVGLVEVALGTLRTKLSQLNGRGYQIVDATGATQSELSNALKKFKN